MKLALEIDSYYRDILDLHDKCKRCLNYHATLTMKDGITVDGIVEKVDSDNIIVLVGEDVMEEGGEGSNQQRQFNMSRQPARFRRFNRRAFPLNALATIALLRYPFIAPPYPYYPYYPY